jgi:mRNA-degrading endonuclease toxin of MazEF toxin-antitoxin module
VGRFQFGQIISAYIADGRGQIKDRPAVVISEDEHNDAGEDLYVVAISKRKEDPCPPYHIPVHDSWIKDPKTGLDAPCVAKCNWIRKIDQSKILGSRGHLDDERLAEIVDEFLKLHNDPTFTKWVGRRPD